MYGPETPNAAKKMGIDIATCSCGFSLCRRGVRSEREVFKPITGLVALAAKAFNRPESGCKRATRAHDFQTYRAETRHRISMGEKRVAKIHLIHEGMESNLRSG